MPAGRPREFNSPEELLEQFKTYLNHCAEDKLVPNITGFSVYCGFHRDTYYDYKNNRREFTDVIKEIETNLEDIALQQMFSARNPAAAMFYLKNKFGYADKTEIETKNLTINADLASLNDEQLYERLKLLSGSDD